MFEERTQQRLLRSAFSQGLANRLGQMLHIVGNKVCQIDIFGSVPNLLVGIKFWCVCRQPFDSDSLLESPRQSLGRTAVHHPAIPDQNNAFRKVLQQCCDKRLSLVSGNVMAKHSEVKSQPARYRRNADSRYNRKSVSAIPAALDWGFAAGCPGSSDDRLKHKAAFICENDSFTAFSRVFLCATSCSFSMIQSHLRCVREPVVRVFGNSSQSSTVHATRPMHRKVCQNISLSQQLREIVSRDRWYSRVFRGIAARAFRAALTDWRSVWTACRCAVLFLGRPGHTVGKLFSTVKPRRALRRSVWLFLNPTSLVPAATWPQADAAPFSCMIMYSSYKILSAKPYCFSELFNGQ